MTIDYRLVIAISCAGLLILALALLVLVVAVRPAWSRRRVLRLQARQDYLNARGTAHRQLLTEALRRTEASLATCLKHLAKARSLKSEAESQLRNDLDIAASKWIVANHLQEITGIGIKIQHELVNSVFKGRLSDLHGAHQLPGIGRQRQAAISAWVYKYEAGKPALIRDGFPGSEEIRSKQQWDIRFQEVLIQDLTADQAALSERIRFIKEQLVRLDGITEQDFLDALRHPDRQSDKLSTYIGGVFEEWETIPAWFRDLLEA